MRNLFIFFAAVLLVGTMAVGVFSDTDDTVQKDGVFVHISHGSDDPHRLLMALNMANMMADDHDVLVYFDISAVDAVLNDSENIEFSHFPKLHEALASLNTKGATLMVCPGCLKVAGKTAEDLAEGIQIANKATFFSFTKGRILTLDY